MESADIFLYYSALSALYIMSLSLVFPLYRLFKGPSLPDRVVALDQIGLIIMGIMLCEVLYSKEKLILDIVLVVAFVLVFGSMIIARYIYKRNLEK
ncbi:MAG: monovalent cation/H+ antiporter complex subunit F [Marinilabiliaceae bacterium]